MLTSLILATLAFAGPGFTYDRHHDYRNPLEQNSRCNACVSFYRVSRPLFPLVNHVVVGAAIEGDCLAAPTKEIYGTTKGAEDRRAFEQFLADPQRAGWRLQLLGQACGAQAHEALKIATSTSRAWQAKVDSDLYFYPRMISTPLWGRICAKAAADVANKLRPHLH